MYSTKDDGIIELRTVAMLAKVNPMILIVSESELYIYRQFIQAIRLNSISVATPAKQKDFVPNEGTSLKDKRVSARLSAVDASHCLAYKLTKKGGLPKTDSLARNSLKQVTKKGKVFDFQKHILIQSKQSSQGR